MKHIKLFEEHNSLSEGFGTRIALGDLEDKVKAAIIDDITTWMKAGGIPQEALIPIQKKLDRELTTVYFDIDTLDVEEDGDSMNILSKELEITPKELAKEIKEVLEKMPAKDLGKYN